MISTNENLAAATPTPTPRVSLADIEDGCFKYSTAHAELSAAVTAMEAEMRTIRDKYLPGLRTLVDQTANAKLALLADLAAAPGLFAKPRTVNFHGVKVGYAMGKGALEIPDHAAFLKALEKLFPNEAQRGQYINVEVTPVKKTLEELPACDLKRLGVRVIPGEDKIVIKCTDGDVEKLVDALLKEATETAAA